jgi:RloB-like protein
MPQNNGKNLGRKPSKPRKVRRILILCEDEKSSRDYFASFPHNKKQVEIHCIGTGKNTDSLIEEAIKRTLKARAAHELYERVWVVFDKDDFPLKNFNRAFDLAKVYKEITACWSNECFELWYLLHFIYIDTAISRNDIAKKISDQLGKTYNKADQSMYDFMKEKLDTALQNAQKLAFENELNGERTRNPSTLIHELVEALLEFDPNKQ